MNEFGTDELSPQSELAGQLQRRAAADKVLVSWSDTTICAHIYLEVREGIERATQLLITTDIPNFNDKAAIADLQLQLLENWQPSGDAHELTARIVRGIPVARIVNESRRIRSVTDQDADYFGFDPKISIYFDDGRRLGFKSAAAYTSAVEQALAAVLYTSAVVSGNAKPVNYVADRMFDGDTTKARNLLTRARRHGRLTAGTKVSGKSTSRASDEALAIVEQAMAYNKQEEGVPDER